ncbi:protein-L-isoaspartate O-methyltransferase [Magnetospira thiophila]
MDFAVARHNMVENQVRVNRVTDPLVLEAMAQVPREDFVPERARGVAYMDDSISLGRDRGLMEPMALARMLQAAAVQSTDVVLDLACGLGYGAAVLARLANTVVAVESDPDLAAQASKILAEKGGDTVAVVEGPLIEAAARQAPYDVILVEGMVGEIPAALIAQLAEGGRLVAVVETAAGLGRAVLVTRNQGLNSRRELFDIGIPPLPEFGKAPTFSL